MGKPGSNWYRAGSSFGRRHPLLVAAAVAAACVATTAWQPGAGFLTSLMLGAAGTVWCGWRRGMLWFGCGALAAGSLVVRDHRWRDAERQLLATRGERAHGRVVRDGEGTERGWVAPVRLDPVRGRAAAVVWWQGRGAVPVAGAVVTASGNFGPLPEPRNPGEFDRGAWLRRQGVAAVFQSGWGDEVVTGWWAAAGAAIRHGFRARVTAGLAEDSQQAAVIRAVVIGESPPHADALIGAFRDSGTLHVFSVSGLHVAMVATLGWWVLGQAGIPRRWAVVILLPLVFGYSWITGNSPPAVRSAWMAALFLGAFVFRRQPDLLNTLGAVLLAAAVWDGRLLYQPGVQLSYGVVAAIAVGSALATRPIARMAAPERYLPVELRSRWQRGWLGARRYVSQSLGVSVAAAVGSAPLTAYHFGLITPVSVAAGLILIPLVFVLLVISLAAVAFSPVVAPVSRALNRLNGHVADASVVAAGIFAAVPGGHWHVRRQAVPELLVYDLEHGAGAACFAAGGQGAVLFDCGDAAGFRYSVLPSLRQLGIEPDTVVLSHPDGGHLGGGAQVWQALPVRQALLPVATSRSPAVRAWSQQAPAAGVRLAGATAGDTLGLPDGATLEVVYAPEPFALHRPADDRVAVYRLLWRGWKILLTSDAGMGTEQLMLDSGRDLSADVIVAGRHRADLTLSDAFLNAVRPQVIIASHRQFPPEERLPAGALDYWRSRGIQGVSQGDAGGVTLTVDDAGDLRLTGFVNRTVVVLTRR